MPQALLIGIAVASTAVQVIQGKKAAKAQKEANKITGANETLRNRSARRKAAKALRIRRAQLEQSATNTGSGASSGEQGAIAAMQASFGAGVSDQTREINTIRGVNVQNQKIANAQSTASMAAAFQELVFTGAAVKREYDKGM